MSLYRQEAQMGSSAFSTLTAKMVMDGSHFKAGIKEAESQVKHFGKDILGELKGEIATAFGAAAVIEFGHKVIEYIKHTKELSEQFGLTTDQVQEFGLSAIKSGQNVEFMAKKLEHLNEMRKKAGEHPFGEEARALAKIGLNQDLIQGPKETAELLGDISEKSMHSATAANDFFEAFAKGGRKMIPILEEMRKAKGKDNSWMLSPKELEETYHAIQKFEEFKMQSEAFGGRLLGQIDESPWKAVGPMGVYTFWKTLLSKRKEGAATAEGHEGAGGSEEGTPDAGKPRYYNQDAEDQYHAAMKAEADLANKIYEIKFKQADKMKQIQLLQEQVVKAKKDEDYWETRMRGHELNDNMELSNAAKEEMHKAQTRRAELEGKIYDTRKSMDSGRLKVSETSGFVTGGNASAGLGYYAHLGAIMGTDTTKAQLKEAQMQSKLQAQIAANTKAKQEKKATF
jgi:hypothetical protein